MKAGYIDEELTLVPYFPCPEVTLPWYQDRTLCYRVDGKDHVYDEALLDSMYSYLSSQGECYYIQYKGTLVGDVTLLDNKELAIVVAPGYQNKHIGRRCITAMIALAKDKGFDQVKANIYSFNTQSQKMFLSLGFRKVDEEWYVYSLENGGTNG